MHNKEFWDECKRLMTEFYLVTPENAEIIVNEMYRRYDTVPVRPGKPSYVTEPSLYTNGPLYFAESFTFWEVDNEGRVVETDKPFRPDGTEW